MDLRHLESFRAVVVYGSFLRAADSLGYAQSTITLHIQQLEAELGLSLFDRNGKRVALSEAGRLVAEQAAHILEHVASLHRTTRELIDGEAGQVRLGAIEPTASLRLPAFLAAYLRQHPGVQLSLEVAGATGVLNRVLAGELDAGVCSPPAAGQPLTFEPLFVEQLALLVPDAHPLAHAPRVWPSDLGHERLLLTERSCAYRKAIDRALCEHGTSRTNDLDLGSMEALKRAVQAGLGVALVPRVSNTPAVPGTLLRDVEGLHLGLTVGLVQRADAPPASRALQSVLTDLAAHLRQVGSGSPPAAPLGV